MIVKMLSALPENKEKWMLKVKIQQEIIQTRSRVNNAAHMFNVPFSSNYRHQQDYFQSMPLRPSSDSSMNSSSSYKTLFM